MPIGTRLKCISNEGRINDIQIGDEYVFKGYDESQIPKNRQNAVMTWYQINLSGHQRNIKKLEKNS